MIVRPATFTGFVLVYLNFCFVNLFRRIQFGEIYYWRVQSLNLILCDRVLQYNSQVGQLLGPEHLKDDPVLWQFFMKRSYPEKNGNGHLFYGKIARWCVCKVLNDRRDTFRPFRIIWMEIGVNQWLWFIKAPMMEKKVDPESCGQLQSAVFKQKEASALRIYRSLKAGRIKRERSTYLSMKVPNANWPQSKKKLCVPFKRCDSF